MQDLISIIRRRFQGRAGHQFRGSVLVASQRAEDQPVLHSMLVSAGWDPVSAGSLDEVLRLSAARSFPVLLCDRKLPGLEWPDGISHLASSAHHPCVVLLSDVADPYLWEELVRHGGFEILPRPFDRTEVLSTLDFAYQHWRTGWPAQHHPIGA